MGKGTKSSFGENSFSLEKGELSKQPSLISSFNPEASPLAREAWAVDLRQHFQVLRSQRH